MAVSLNSTSPPRVSPPNATGVLHDEQLLPGGSLPFSLRVLMESPLTHSHLPDPADVSPRPRSFSASSLEAFSLSPDPKSAPPSRTPEREWPIPNANVIRSSAVPIIQQPRVPDVLPSEDVTCVYFSTEGFCRNGDSCRFSHQQASRPPLCKFYKTARGCHFGAQCRYSHETILCERIKVPESCLGALIGKNGTTRARLEAESRIENITIMTSSKEVVLTARDPAGITRASKLVMEVVKQCELRQQRKAAEAVAAAAAAVAAIEAKTPSKGKIESPIQGFDSDSPGRLRRGRNQKRRPQSQQSSSSSPISGAQSGWHQCVLCRKSFSTISALTNHQRAKRHSSQGSLAEAAAGTPTIPSSLDASMSIAVPFVSSLESIQRSLSGLSLSKSVTPSKGQSASDDEFDADVHGRRIKVEMNSARKLSSPSLSPESSLSESDRSEHDQSSELQYIPPRHVVPAVQRVLFPRASKPDIWNSSSISHML